ncbi:hypothetical protein ACSTDR_13320 [Vibrio vulnificus]|uniref:hypothetical protein n=1 Tax=Vibrio vulnificus TaxID=672 RepID=UPI003ED8C083
MVVLLVSLARRAYHFQQLASSSTPIHECRTYYLKSGLIKEHKHQFEELDNLIDCFRAKQKEYTFNELVDLFETNFIRGRKISEIPIIDGVKYKDAEDLGAFVYKLGLISKKSDCGRYFTHYCDDPDLFRTNQNREGQITWSVHIAYRKYLNIR